MLKLSTFIIFLSIIFSSKIQGQTIQSDIPDSVIKKFECKKLYKIIDASRTKFKTIRGKRKPLKYSEIYVSTLNPKHVNSGQIYVDGRSIQYQAFLVKTQNRGLAAEEYRKIVAVAENCLEGWIIETEPEEENQLYRFKAHEKEDMISGVTVEIIFYKQKGNFIVELIIQP
ncbi:MAG: hypothetical protein HYZ42_00825 [Bacteroidetes bacterium]|nr:hypothetical protein [Bacteroidota bacterium]